MSKEIVLSRIMGLSTQSFSFSAPANAFVGNGYTSGAGNHYFSFIRFADGILIKEEIGIGYKYQFINAIRIYSIKDKTLLADSTFHGEIYNPERIKTLAIQMLMQKLRESAALENYRIDETEASKTIRQLVCDAYQVNQMDMAQKQLARLLA